MSELCSFCKLCNKQVFKDGTLVINSCFGCHRHQAFSNDYGIVVSCDYFINNYIQLSIFDLLYHILT